jgi:hypothetical protein
MSTCSDATEVEADHSVFRYLLYEALKAMISTEGS